MSKQRTPVYVVNRKGRPLMPTFRFGHVRKLMKEGRAVPISNEPFTIRLKYDTPDITQELYGGVDTGRENIGLAASKEDGAGVYLSDVKTNNKSVKKQMADRAGFRGQRRRHRRISKQRKAIHDGTEMQSGNEDTVRTRKPCKSKDVMYPGAENPVTHKVIKGKEGKFNNRKRQDGWITPSARQLVQVTVSSIKNMLKILPLTQINIERVCFDFQKLENEDIKKWQYSKGPLYGFKDYKEYIFEEQHGRCLLCGAPIQQYHHISQQKDGKYDHVSNIAGLCRCCHDDCHHDEGTQARLKELKAGAISQYQIGLLNSVMPALIEEMDRLCTENGIRFHITEGNETAATREKYEIQKDHCTDAYCISLAGRDDITDTSLPEDVFLQRRFKKKARNMISKRGRREYWYNGKLVAVNRHKAMDQTKDSLEEYMAKYAKTHTEKECQRHFHELKVRPAKRIYTFHKQGLKLVAHPGDIVSYTKKNKIRGNTKHKIVVAEEVRHDNEGGHVGYNSTKSFKSIYCKPIGSGCVQYIGHEKLKAVLANTTKEQGKTLMKKKNTKNTEKVA